MRGRPQVHYLTGEEPKQVLANFEEALEKERSPCTGFVGRREVTLFVSGERNRVWSPYLQLAVTANEKGGAQVSGKMGPKPSLWTAYVFVYSLHVVIFIAGTMLGFVQTTLNDTPVGFYATAYSLLGLSIFCGLDLLGRKFAEAQMGILRGMVLATLGDAQEGTVYTTPNLEELS